MLPSGSLARRASKLVTSGAGPRKFPAEAMARGGVLLPAVSTKVVVADWDPSETVRVTVAEPVCPAAGTSVTDRLAPDPARVMAEVGSSAGLDEVAESVSSAAGVSKSSRVTGWVGVATPGVVCWFSREPAKLGGASGSRRPERAATRRMSTTLMSPLRSGSSLKLSWLPADCPDRAATRRISVTLTARVASTSPMSMPTVAVARGRVPEASVTSLTETVR